MLWLIILHILIHSCKASCPNLCNQQGYCNTDNACECYSGYTGLDCSSKVCETGTAWADKANGANSAHQTAECSNAGICDTENGVCRCFNGFTGSACQRLSCPNNCNDRGLCMTMRDASVYFGRDYDSTTENSGDGLGFEYDNWDARSIQMCKCNYGYSGPDCSLVLCPKGDDPYTTGQDYRTIELVVTTLHYKSLSGDLGITFQGETTFFSLTSAATVLCTAQLKASPQFEDLTCDFSQPTPTRYVFLITFLRWPRAPKENNFYSHDGNPPITDFYCDISRADPDVKCTFNDVVSTNVKEYEYCSNRGICNFDTGECSCADGFGGMACENITNRYSAATNALIARDVAVKNPSDFLSTVVRVNVEKPSGSDFQHIVASSNSTKHFEIRGDGELGGTEFVVQNAGATIARGGLQVESGGFTVATDGTYVYGRSDSTSPLEVTSSNELFVDDVLEIKSQTTSPSSANYLLKAYNRDAVKFSVRGDGLVNIDGGGAQITGGSSVVTGGIAATGGLSVATTGLKVTGGLTVQSGGASLTTGLSVPQTGVKVTGGCTIDGGLAITAGGMTVTAGGADISDGGLLVSGGGTVASGGLRTTDGLTVNSNGLKVTGGSTVLLGGLKVTGGITVHNNGFDGTHGLTVNAGGVKITGGVSILGGATVTGGITVVTAGLTITSGASILATGLTVVDGVTIESAGAHVYGGMKLTGGLTVYSSGARITGGLTVVDTGLYVLDTGTSIYASGIKVTGGATITTSGIRILSGGMKLTGGLTVFNSGLQVTNGLTAASKLEVVAGGASVASGGIKVAGGLTVEDSGANVMGLQVTDGMTLRDTGAVVTGGLTVVDTGVFVTTDGGTIAAGGLNVQGGLASDELHVEVSGLDVTGGVSVASGGMKVAGGITHTISGMTVPADGMSVTSSGMVVTGGVTVSSGGVFVEGGGAHVTGGFTVSVSGVTVTGGVTISDTGLVITSDGVSVATGGLEIAGGATVSTGGVRVETSGFELTGGLSIGDSSLRITGGLTISDTGLGIDASGGTIGANGLKIASGLTVTGNTLSAPDIVVTGGLSARGSAVITGGLTVHTSGLKVESSSTNTITGNSHSTGTLCIANNLNGNFVVNPSDRRLKEDITPVKDSLDSITKLRGVYYKWSKDSPQAKFHKKRNMGLIAQDVQKLFPELVTKIMDGDYLGVNYIQLIPVMIEAIRELEGKYSQLDHEYRELGIRSEKCSCRHKNNTF